MLFQSRLLATAVSVAPHFLLWANMPQYSSQSMGTTHSVRTWNGWVNRYSVATIHSAGTCVARAEKCRELWPSLLNVRWTLCGVTLLLPSAPSVWLRTTRDISRTPQFLDPLVLLFTDKVFRNLLVLDRKLCGTEKGVLSGFCTLRRDSRADRKESSAGHKGRRKYTSTSKRSPPLIFGGACRLWWEPIALRRLTLTVKTRGRIVDPAVVSMLGAT
jgi:hypothetical protein